MKDGFLIGGSLVIAGLVLQVCIGPVEWSVFAWPVNGVALAGFIAVIIVMFLLRGRAGVPL
jgi:hypothetical protein